MIYYNSKFNYIQRLALLFVLVGLCNSSLMKAQGFTDVSWDAGIDFLVDHQSYMGGGVSFFDYDMDGELDIYIAGGEDRDRLYRNLGDGTFEETGIAAGFESTNEDFTHGVVTGDIDNDGFREVFLTTYDSNTEGEFASNRLYKNNGDGTFTDISEIAGIQDSTWSSSATFGDFNLDGYLDIYVTNYVMWPSFIKDSTGQVIGFDHYCLSDYLYMNNGDETFTDQALEFGIDDPGCGLAVAATDYNSDGNVDLMVANDFGEFVVSNRLYQNPGFMNVSEASGIDVGIYGMGIAPGDYDGDGDLDYYTTNLGRNVLMQNQGDGTFIDVATEANVENTAVDSLLVTSWGTAFLDYDNDTYLDLFVCNGYISAAAFIATTLLDPNKFYRNNQDGTFTDIAVDLGLDNNHVGRGFAVGDYDKDGDQDMLVANLNYFNSQVDPKVILYRNNNTSGNFVQVKVEGLLANRDAFGAQVTIHAGGRSFLREVDGGSSHASQNSHILHFGLGEIEAVDSLEILWPGGRRQKACDISINQMAYILEDTSNMTSMITCYSPPNSIVELQAADINLHNVPNPFGDHTTISYQLPFSARVKLQVTDALGRTLKVLDSGVKNAGEHELRFESAHLPTGIYFYHLQIDGVSFSSRMVVVK